MPAADRSVALTALLEPAVGEAGLVLERVTVTPAGRRSVVRVVVDLPQGPGSLDLDAVAAVSRAVSAVLDGPDGDVALGSAPFVLEVTSPGVDRPLTQPRHWSRAQGRLVEVVPVGGTEVSGRVVAVDDDGVTVGDQQLSWAALEGAAGRVQVELRRPEPDEDDDAVDEQDEHGDDADEQDDDADGHDDGGSGR